MQFAMLNSLKANFFLFLAATPGYLRELNIISLCRPFIDSLFENNKVLLSSTVSQNVMLPEHNHEFNRLQLYKSIAADLEKALF
jgi:hypothetical protein